jgi:eukaryotic-like serine/threonine-protein kinase
MALSIGSLLAGRYEITAPVAVGGMGEVWRARDRVLDRTVAAKVLRSEYTGDPNFLARFRNEARHTAALSHPNIASVYDYGETRDEHDQDVAYLVMEFVEGQTLVQILHDEGRLPVDWTLHVLGQAAEGLSAAHRAGVVHRDIKPGNLIIRPDGVVKLTDFGIAQARDATPLTRTGMVVGTAQYLSPEQAQGMEVTAASDVYSLGVVAYECLAGARPFDGTSQVAIALAHINRPPPPLPPDVPPPVESLIERALAKDAAERFPDGAAFAEAVRAVASGGTLPGAVPVTGGLAAAGAPTEIVDLPEDGTRVLSGAAAGALATGAGPSGPGTRPRPMPPLRGTPDDDVDGYPEDDEPPRRRRYAWLAAGLVLLLAAGAVAWLLLRSGSDPGTGQIGTSTTTSGSSSSSSGVFVNTDGFIGKPADVVQPQLEAQGLTVTRQEATRQQIRSLGRALAAGDVVGSAPANATVARGSSVVLYVTPAAYTPDSGGGSSAATTTAAPTTHKKATPTPTPSATPSATPTDTPTPTSTPSTSAPSTITTGGGTEVTSSAPVTTSSAAAAGSGGVSP